MDTVRLVDGDTQLTIRPQYPSGNDPLWLQEIDLGSPAARENKANDSGQSGTLDDTEFWGASSVTLKIKVRGNADASKERIADTLRYMCAPYKRPQLFVRQDDWAAERVATLRPNPLSMIRVAKSAAYHDYSLSFSNISGVFQDTTEVPFTMYAPSSAPALQLIPGAFGDAALRLIPGAFGDAALRLTPGNSTSVLTLTNPGTAPTPLVLYFYGRSTAATITDETYGQKFAFKSDFTIPEGHYVQVDFKSRTVYMDSDPTQSFYGSVDWTKSSWWTVQPQSTRFLYDAKNVSGTSAMYGSIFPNYF